MSATPIEWTDDSWNAVTGCDRVSPGCKHCYFLEEINRYSKMLHGRYAEEGEILVHRDKLREPHTWKKGRLVFVNSTSDFFHEQIERTVIETMLQTMRETPRHVYQILTKRSDRLAQLGPKLDWPGNVWMGVSVESGDVYKKSMGARPTDRIDQLRQSGASRLFLSVEPLIGPVGALDLSGIGWVIVGGESGTGEDVRAMDLEWAREVVAQCRAAGVPVFVKQLGTLWARAEVERLRRERPSGWQENARRLSGSHTKGGQEVMDLWPQDLRVAEFPPQMQPYARKRRR